MSLTKCTHEMSSTETECSEDMAAKSKIAVIIPIHNSEKYLEECLLSVAEQSLKEIEIICVDDGSTDDSASIINDFSKKDLRIKYVCIEHSGPGTARNVGIDESYSDFVAFMDSDDIYPNAGTLERLYFEAKMNDVHICGGSWSEKIGDQIVTSFQDPEYTFREDGIVCYMDYQFDFGYHRFIYDSDFLNKNNIRFPPLLRYQDPPFFVLAMCYATRFYSLGEPTYCRRTKNENVLSTKDRILDFIKGIRMVFELADKYGLNGLRDRTVRRLSENIFAIAEGVMISELDSVSGPLIDLYSYVHRIPDNHRKLPSPILVILADTHSDKRVVSAFLDLWKRDCCKLFPANSMFPIFNTVKKYGLAHCLRRIFSTFRRIVR